VADANDGGLPGSVEEAAASLIGDPATFPAHGNGIRFAEISREER